MIVTKVEITYFVLDMLHVLEANFSSWLSLTFISFAF